MKRLRMLGYGCWWLAGVALLGCSGSDRPAAESGAAQYMPFDSAQWRRQSGEDYPFRAALLPHLMESDTLRGMPYHRVLQWLGPATRADTNYLFYRVHQRRLGWFPLHTTTLVVRFGPDSLVNGILVHR